jgi:hypothetical protein
MSAEGLPGQQIFEVIMMKNLESTVNNPDLIVPAWLWRGHSFSGGRDNGLLRR